MITIRDATTEDAVGIADLINECRKSWEVYYPHTSIERVIDFIDGIPFDRRLARVVFVDDTLVGAIAFFTYSEGNNFTTLFNDILCVSKARCKGFTLYSVLSKMLDEVYNFAILTGCYRVSWTMGTLEYEAISKLLDKKYGSKARQVGVCIDVGVM